MTTATTKSSPPEYGGATGSASIDTDSQNNATCPHCGYVDRDSWEIDFGPAMDGETECDCARCGKAFIAAREVSVYYSTRKTPNG